MTAVAASGFHSYRGDSRAVFVVGPAGTLLPSPIRATCSAHLILDHQALKRLRVAVFNMEEHQCKPYTSIHVYVATAGYVSIHQPRNAVISLRVMTEPAFSPNYTNSPHLNEVTFPHISLNVQSFRKTAKSGHQVLHVCLTDRPHGTTRLPTGRILMNSDI